ncbi:hypothetical protein [Kitasatospora cineracea]|uniref:hypothetical protein n=1 Tax=Kitasatospora cineracea TaxID=88074 RepID=UPI00380953AD
MSALPPIVGADLWQAVTTAAGMRCQCSGTCGSKHTAGGGRCERIHGGWSGKHGGILRLLVAPTDPADLLLPAHRAAALAPGQLSAWCPACHHGAHAAARKAQQDTVPAAPDALFDL